jgi:hypothetical protein
MSSNGSNDLDKLLSEASDGAAPQPDHDDLDMDMIGVELS